MPTIHAPCPSLESLASRVRRRVAGVRFLRALSRSAAAVGLGALAAVLYLRLGLGWQSGELALVLFAVGIWLAALGALASWRRPGTFDALVLLDRRGGWKDRFSSAWLFRSHTDPASAEAWHVRRTETETPAALAGLSAAIPLPRPRALALLLPLIALGLAATPLGRVAPAARDLALTERMRETATAQAEELRRNAESFLALDSLDEEEREALEALRVEVLDTATMLADSEGLTAGEMLEALAERARAAERLAEKLGLGTDEWASREMLAEMERHPDLAGLALAIRDKAARPAAIESEGIHALLDRDSLSAEVRDRLATATERVMRAARDEDRERPVGERVGNADLKLRDGQAKTAAREFLELAKHFRLLEGREAAKDRLNEIAESLREAGSEISGSELQRLEELAAEERGAAGDAGGEGGLQPLIGGDLPQDLAELLAPQFGQIGARAPTEGEAQEGAVAGAPTLAEGQVPGEESGPPQEGQAPSGGDEFVLQAPVPGESPIDGSGAEGMGLAEQSRAGEGEDGALTAPVPGMEPADESAPGGGVSAGAGATSQGVQGGDGVGTGTAPLLPVETGDLPAAAVDARVAAQVGEEGESTVRAVEGRARAEEASRPRSEIVSETLAAEEQALDGQSIPLSRRGHIIRYFSAIREQFEEAPAGAPSR